MKWADNKRPLQTCRYVTPCTCTSVMADCRGSTAVADLVNGTTYLQCSRYLLTCGMVLRTYTVQQTCWLSKWLYVLGVFHKPADLLNGTTYLPWSRNLLTYWMVLHTMFQVPTDLLNGITYLHCSTNLLTCWMVIHTYDVTGTYWLAKW